MKVAARTKKPSVIVEHLLMNINASATETQEILRKLEAETGRPLGPMGQRVFQSLTRIAETAFYATGVNRGQRAIGGQFNEHLLELLGEETLN